MLLFLYVAFVFKGVAVIWGAVLSVSSLPGDLTSIIFSGCRHYHDASVSAPEATKKSGAPHSFY